MYTLDIDLQKRLYNLWPAHWISMILFFILGLFVYKSFFTLVVMLAVFTKQIRQMKKEHKKLIEDPKEHAFVNLNNDDFYYKEGHNKYNVHIPYKEIRDIKLKQYIGGLNCISILLEKKRKLSIWNLNNPGALTKELHERKKLLN